MKNFITVHNVRSEENSWTNILITQLMAFTAILSIGSAAPSPAAAAAAKPQGYIDAFHDIGCLEGKFDEADQAGLTQGGCANFDNVFSSFRGTHHDSTQ